MSEACPVAQKQWLCPNSHDGHSLHTANEAFLHNRQITTGVARSTDEVPRTTMYTRRRFNHHVLWLFAHNVQLLNPPASDDES